MKVLTEVLEELLDVINGEIVERDGLEFKRITTVSDRDSRWVEYRWLIFEYDNLLWQAEYAVGLTEMQENEPFEYVEDGNREVECAEVEAFQIMTTSYKLLK